MAPEMLDDRVSGNDYDSDCDDNRNDGDNNVIGVYRVVSAAGDVWSFAMTALVSLDHL